jgi:hypothetical protein
MMTRWVEYVITAALYAPALLGLAFFAWVQIR